MDNWFVSARGQPYHDGSSNDTTHQATSTACSSRDGHSATPARFEPNGPEPSADSIIHYPTEILEPPHGRGRKARCHRLFLVRRGCPWPLDDPNCCQQAYFRLQRRDKGWPPDHAGIVQ